MAPAWVLLDRLANVRLEDGEDEAAAAEKQKGVAQPSAIDLLGSMKPDVRLLLAPPKIASLRFVGSTKYREDLDLDGLPRGSSVACADKSLVVLYGGSYGGPGSSGHGCYLVYDAAASTSPQLATVPRLPLAAYLIGIGNGAVVLHRHPPPEDAATASSSYLLAELAATPQLALPDAELYLWWSDAPTAEWVKKAVRLPREVSWEPGKHNFNADASFTLGPSNLCWVDLLHGIVICKDPGQQDPQFRFIPLPEGCSAVSTSKHRFRPRVHEFRSVRCIDGEIKLVAVEGILEGWDSNQFSLAIWTLSPDLSVWKKGEVFCLQDLWAKDEYIMLKLPRHTPICPVLGANNVIYIIVNNVEMRNIVRGSELLKTEVDIKGQYVLELDMKRKSILSVSCHHPPSLGQLMPSLLATDFTAYLQGSKDHQKKEASEETKACRG